MIYPLTDEWHSITYVIKRMKANNIFPKLNDMEIGDLIIENSEFRLSIFHEGLDKWVDAPIEHMSASNYVWIENDGFDVGNYSTDEIYLSKEDIKKLENKPFPDNKKNFSNIKINDNKLNNRINAFYNELEILEAIAEQRDIPFERSEIPCNKEMLYKWIRDKEPNIFSGMNKLSTFNGFFKKHIKDCHCVAHYSKVDKEFFNKLKS